jgi:homoserine dehydrogenase
VPHLAFHPSRLSDAPILPVEETTSAYYLRLQAVERPGVLAHVTRILGEKGINIEAIIQKQTTEAQVPVIMLTQRVEERMMNEAIREIEALPDILGEIIRIRVELLAD